VSDLHTAWARLFAQSLAESGVGFAVISPGSRSTPLALALARVLPVAVLHDERVAAFFALGQGRASGRPAAVLATSGTAPGHWLPAAMEAREAGIPLLLISADRPWEVQEAQASQTVDQLRLFGHHARAFFDLGVPDEHPAALAAVPRIAAQAVLATRYPLAGAVHINARFRKPLEPQPSDGQEPWRPAYDKVARAGAPRLIPPCPAPDPAAVALLAERVRANPRGVLVAGPLPATDAPELRKAVERFLEASGYVLLAEATSQLRFGLESARPVGAFDALLRSAELRSELRPDLAIEIGAPAVSAQWLAFISGTEAPQRIVLPGERPADPAGGASAMLLGPIAALLEAAAGELEAAPPAATPYASAWQAAEAAAWAARDLAAEGVPAEPLHEHQVAAILRQALPAGGTLMVGNSNPVRDLDHDLPPDSAPLAVLHQRGAAGIDGLISGAAGARTVLAGPLALLLGDVAALHDAGGLAAAAAVRGPLAIVVVHNDGGRIFERLPLGRDQTLAEDCQTLFVAAHNHAFDGLAATFGLRYARAETPDALCTALGEALAADRPMLIEARVAAGGSATRSALLAAMAKAGANALDSLK
jgi:2-succinyl-5-enolpyruvyl-6-hydroxy-3-cyclohexene-1-carboxylate synthase